MTARKAFCIVVHDEKRRVFQFTGRCTTTRRSRTTSTRRGRIVRCFTSGVTEVDDAAPSFLSSFPGYKRVRSLRGVVGGYAPAGSRAG